MTIFLFRTLTKLFLPLSVGCFLCLARYQQTGFAEYAKNTDIILLTCLMFLPQNSLQVSS